MTSRKRIFGTLAVLALSALPVVAQPDPNNAPKAANPPVQVPFGIDGAQWQKMTPQQRREAIQKGVEQTLRGSMTWLGFTEKPLQDAVIDCMTEQETAAEPVRERHRMVTQALLNRAMTDENVATLMTELQSAQDKAKEQRQTAIDALDEKIGFSKKPRLQAFLSTVGLVGDQGNFIGGVMGSLMSAMANLAVGAENPAAPPAPAPAEKAG